MNSMAKTENLARWSVEERMADGRWRVPRYAPRPSAEQPPHRRDEVWEDGEYRAWTFLRSLVERGLLGWLDEYEVGAHPRDHGFSFDNPKGGIFCNRHRLVDGGRDSWQRLCATYPGSNYCGADDNRNIGGVWPSSYPDDPRIVAALLDGVTAKGWFRT